jgi:isopenicillin-N N-acyltransferase-like protein
VTRFPLIEIEGEAYERGGPNGAREFHTNLKRPAILKAAESFGPILEAHAPDLLVEMRGIADGVECDLLDVVLVNARSELMSGMDECTSLATGPAVTSRGQVLLGQNWDWYTAVETEPVLLRILQPDRPTILTVCEAGQVGKIGMNSAGLGVCLNFLSHAERGQGVPIHVILRQMLGCTHLGEAVREAYRVPRGGAANVLLAHTEGEILDLELTAAAADFLYGDDGWLVHTNHFESARLRGGDTGVATSMSSLARAARARRLLSAACGQVTMDTFHTILSDHAYGAYAICRHAEPSESALQQTATRASLVMDLQTRTMYLAAGQPCQEEYEAFSLSR